MSKLSDAHRTEYTPTADSPEETDSVGAPSDDGGLTIRIPNPKVYMARQSQWKGRRGKPRCDHCRTNNLKCDRVLPACNHCVWSNGKDCRYTPLPTPAHRGIPRCDRCRIKNLKCDRNLPVCNHCDNEEGAECNYTPKKRHKIPEEHISSELKPIAASPYTTKSASFLVSDVPPSDDSMDAEPSAEKLSRELAGGSERSPSLNAKEDKKQALDRQRIAQQAANVRKLERSVQPWMTKSNLPPLAPKTALPGESSSSLPSCFLDQRSMLVPPRVEPWAHPEFSALPEVVLRHLRSANAMEMPSRQSFDESLVSYFMNLAAELKETAAFPPDAYAEVAKAVAKGDVSTLSPRRLMWTEIHHIRSGSAKRHLLLLPRDPYFQIDRADEEKLRVEYVAHIDRKTPYEEPKVSNGKDSGETASLEWTLAFERVPVQTQLYDVLVYAHRNHGSSSSMLFEARRVGIATITWPMVEIFTRLCPLCNLRAKTNGIALATGIGPGESSSSKR
ncbi:hypothetical protein OE88DRAFT_1655016 [Heliocybe sulcata]|uniref:Zn(2)-C6 fungal-type domain-containing protein n=1 Tax=Heliocybe sulcata TaxID=5364 RepID=A0A5C3NEA7_9AGAM|nr:hypothetical protein OE88DRAFT_1655016 [Heliocybe sulcata]